MSDIIETVCKIFKFPELDLNKQMKQLLWARGICEKHSRHDLIRLCDKKIAQITDEMHEIDRQDIESDY